MALYRPKYKGGGRSPTYHYDFTCRGVRHKGSTGETNKIKAREVETEKRKLVKLGRSAQEIVPITFDALAEKYLVLHVPNLKRPDNYKSSVRRLRRAFGKRMVASITPLDCDTVMADRWRSSKNGGTYNALLVHMKHIFSRAEKWQFLAKGTNPADDIEFKKAPKRERAPTEDEVDAIRAVSDGGLSRIIRFAFLTMGRSEECRRLTWANVRFDLGYLVFMDTKSGENRRYPLGRTVREFLESLPGSQGFGGAAHVFQIDGQPISESVLGRHFRAARRKAELDWVHFHDLRAAGATALANAGVPVRTLMTMAGWRTPEMALRYMRNTKYNQQLAIEAQDRAFGAPQNPHTQAAATA